jgi:hypothetical protein
MLTVLTLDAAAPRTARRSSTSTLCSLNVPRMFSECPPNVPWMFPECSLLTLVLGSHVGKLYSASTLVLLLSASCIWDGGLRASAQLKLNVPWMLPECSLGVPCIGFRYGPATYGAEELNERGEHNGEHGEQGQVRVPVMFPKCFLNSHRIAILALTLREGLILQPTCTVKLNPWSNNWVQWSKHRVEWAKPERSE